MTEWSLSVLLGGLHDEIQQKLATARKALVHPGTKGDASESVWLEMLQLYLPQRYRATKGHVVDSNGKFSDQIDVLIFDRQYSPFIFQFQGQTIIPAESVYAAFEAKQTINAEQVDYAHKKIASVRLLHRTSLPIPTAMGLLPAKSLHHIRYPFVSDSREPDPPPNTSEPQTMRTGNAPYRFARLEHHTENSPRTIPTESCCQSARMVWLDSCQRSGRASGDRPAHRLSSEVRQ